jgi:hypothetical protein
MVDNSIALGVKAPEIGAFNPLQAALVASQIRAADNQNSLAQLQIGERTDQSNALADYRSRVAANDPNADTALAGQPDLMTKVVQARAAMKEDQRKTLDDNLLRNAQGAQRVLGLPADQRQAAWNEELDAALKDKRINPLQYERMKSMPPDEKVLTPIVKAGSRSRTRSRSSRRKRTARPVRNSAAAWRRCSAVGRNPRRRSAAAGGGPSYFTKLKVAESGGNPAATPPVNPETGKPASTASGLFQFTKGTWDAVAAKNPDLDLKPEDRTGTTPEAIAKQEKAAKALTATTRCR